MNKRLTERQINKRKYEDIWRREMVGHTGFLSAAKE